MQLRAPVSFLNFLGPETGALGCMHKAPKCIQSLWDHPKKISFCAKVQRKRDMCDP